MSKPYRIDYVYRGSVTISALSKDDAIDKFYDSSPPKIAIDDFSDVQITDIEEAEGEE